MDINKQQQLALFDRNANNLFDAAVAEMVANKHLIIATARQRLEQGFELYGCTMWAWSLDVLRANRFEEYADGLNYMLPEAAE
jgi:hypothetical protein